jgi:hypothetical protein
MNYTQDPNFHDDDSYHWAHARVKGWLVPIGKGMTQQQWADELYPAATASMQ